MGLVYENKVPSTTQHVWGKNSRKRKNGQKEINTVIKKSQHDTEEMLRTNIQEN